MTGSSRVVNGISVHTSPAPMGWVAWADMPDGLRIRAAGRKTESGAVAAVSREIKSRTRSNPAP